MSTKTAPADWKSCESELPDDELTVLVHHPEEDDPVWLGYLYAGRWRTAEGVRCCVSHWMPLPEPPSLP